MEFTFAHIIIVTALSQWIWNEGSKFFIKGIAKTQIVMMILKWLTGCLIKDKNLSSTLQTDYVQFLTNIRASKSIFKKVLKIIE